MPQLSLYLTDEEMARFKKSAKEAGLSLSKYAAQAISEKSKRKGWPAGFFDLYGSITDPDFKEPSDEYLDPSLDDDCNWFESGEEALDVPA